MNITYRFLISCAGFLLVYIIARRISYVLLIGSNESKNNPISPQIDQDFNRRKTSIDDIHNQENLAELYYQNQKNERRIDRRAHDHHLYINANYPCILVSLKYISSQFIHIILYHFILYYIIYYIIHTYTIYMKGTNPIGLSDKQSIIDGHKYGCGIPYIEDDPIVYSFGSNNQQDFEKGFLNLRPTSKIFVFEILKSHIPPLEFQDSRIQFFNIGLGGYQRIHNNNDDNNTLNNEFIYMNLSSIMKMLGHNYIDVLKMDIEGAEYDFIYYESNLFSHIGQYLVEVHSKSNKNYKSNQNDSGPVGYFINKLEMNSMRLFHREHNIFAKTCSEYSLIRNNWINWNNNEKFKLKLL